MGSTLTTSIVGTYRFFKPQKIDGEVLIDKNTEHYKFLSSDVKIVTDKFGVGHIYGKSKLDVFFGQGFFNAQQRLVEIDIKRRVGLGTLAEVKPEALLIDRVSRTLGFARLAKKDEKFLNKENRSILEAYVAGMNYYLESKAFRKPEEVLFGYPSPRKFTCVDLLAITRLLNWQMNKGYLYKVVNVAIEEFFGKKTNDLDFHHLCEKDIDLQRLTKLVNDEPIEQNLGSNAFVISGEHTKSGKPILENDAHLKNKSPSIWIRTHLICDEFDCTGHIVGGLPGIFSGFNTFGVAFGVTNSHMDSFDLYLQKLNDKNQYEYEGELKDCEVFEEIIKIKGGKTHVEKVLMTNNGVIISNVINFQKEKKVHYSLKGISFEHMGNQILDFVKMPGAKSTSDMLEVFKSLKTVAFTLAVADKSNDIAMVITGNTPKRTPKALKRVGLPFYGWDKDYDWQGYYDVTDKIVRNPKCGYLIGCNSNIFEFHGIKSPYYISNCYGGVMTLYRAKRFKQLIEQGIQNKTKFTVEMANKFSNDITQFEVPFTKFMDSVSFKKKTAENRIFMEAKSVLSKFDGSFSIDSVGASLYSVFKYELIINLLSEFKGVAKTDKEMRRIANLLFGNGLSPQFLASNHYFGVQRTLAIHLLSKFEEPKKKGIIKQSLKDAVEKLIRKIPEAKKFVINNPKKAISLMNWGKIHTISWKHVIPGYNLGGNPSGGNWMTPKLEGYLNDGEDFHTMYASSMKTIVDLGDLSLSLSAIYPGNCCIPGSPNFGDCVPLYQKNQLRSSIYQKQEIEKNKIGTLIIKRNL